MDRVHGLQLTSIRDSLNDGHWLSDPRLRLTEANRYSWSNLHYRSRSGWLGATSTGGEGGAPVGGTTDTRWWLTRVGRIRRSGPWFSMRFWPAALGRREEPTLLTLGGRRATMAAGVGGAARRQWRRAPGLLRLNRGNQGGWQSSVKLLGRSIWRGRWHTVWRRAKHGG
jgi:hypothetical protein